MKPSIRTYLCNDENHRFFGEGPRQLLHAIDETGSLRSAALSMNMAYTKALRIIRDAETTLGFPLTVRTTTDFRTAAWRKMLTNVAPNPITALTL